MHAKSIETVAISNESRGHRLGAKPWSICAILAFGSCSLCFLTGLIVSVAGVFGVFPASSTTGRWTVCMLLAAFLLAFLGAHAVDKLDDVS